MFHEAVIGCLGSWAVLGVCWWIQHRNTVGGMLPNNPNQDFKIKRGLIKHETKNNIVYFYLLYWLIFNIWEFYCYDFQSLILFSSCRFFIYCCLFCFYILFYFLILSFSMCCFNYFGLHVCMKDAIWIIIIISVQLIVSLLHAASW